MFQKVFIQQSDKGELPAKLAKFAIERKLPPGSTVKVEIIEAGTLSHPSLLPFTVPERMTYGGRALVIKPSVFAIQDISPLFELDMEGNRIAAAKQKSGWDTSVMLLDCEKLKDWRTKDFLRAIKDGHVELAAIEDLSIEPDIMELPRIWNSCDTLTPETKILNIANPLTRPWKAGLPLDSENITKRKFLGFIPTDLLNRVFKSAPRLHEKHQSLAVEAFFEDLFAQAYKAGTVDNSFIKKEIHNGHVDPDLLSRIRQ